jgi:predicted secreted acid phosphatase
VAKRVAPSVHVEAKLSALPSDSLAQALRDLQTMVQDWISKHYPNSLKQQRFERSDINVETANTP